MSCFKVGLVYHFTVTVDDPLLHDRLAFRVVYSLPFEPYRLPFQAFYSGSTVFRVFLVVPV